MAMTIDGLAAQLNRGEIDVKTALDTLNSGEVLVYPVFTVDPQTADWADMEEAGLGSTFGAALHRAGAGRDVFEYVADCVSRLRAAGRVIGWDDVPVAQAAEAPPPGEPTSAP